MRLPACGLLLCLVLSCGGSGGEKPSDSCDSKALHGDRIMRQTNWSGLVTAADGGQHVGRLYMREDYCGRVSGNYWGNFRGNSGAYDGGVMALFDCPGSLTVQMPHDGGAMDWSYSGISCAQQQQAAGTLLLTSEILDGY